MDLILAEKTGEEICVINNYTEMYCDVNTDRIFRLTLSTADWDARIKEGCRIYVPGTEIGGLVGKFETDTSLGEIKVYGDSWRGLMEKKDLSPPSGQDYLQVSGELNSILQQYIEPRFSGIYLVPDTPTGKNVTNYQVDRYVTLHAGLSKMLASVGYRLDLAYRSGETMEPGYLEVQAAPLVDYSKNVELSQDFDLGFNLVDTRNGYNHIIALGKGDLKDREVLHLYAQADGSIGSKQYYTGVDERVYIYDDNSSDDLNKDATEKFKELLNSQTFDMSMTESDIEPKIGDIVGGRDYITGRTLSKPIENKIYTIDGKGLTIDNELEGEGD